MHESSLNLLVEYCKCPNKNNFTFFLNIQGAQFLIFLKICWFSNLTEILSIDEYKFAFSERLIFKSLGEQLFSYIMVRTSYISMRWSSLCARQINTPSWIFIKLAHCNNSTQVDMLLYSNTFPDFEATSLSGEVANTNFIVLGLTWQGLESKIYCTGG